jgi:hypothetical protein
MNFDNIQNIVNDIVALQDLKKSTSALKQFNDECIAAGFSTSETGEIIKNISVGLFWAHFNIMGLYEKNTKESNKEESEDGQ